MTALCPCQSGSAYADCCEPLHRRRPIADAEALMRSRDAVYGLKNIDYIIGTTASGRKQLCLCGSGKKFKHCCGGLL